MNSLETAIPGVFVFEPRVFRDTRGFFLETYSQRTLAQFGINTLFMQDNHSMSRRGTLRGLHYQLKQPQTKLCRVVRGAVLDVVLDVRRGSPAFGKWVAEELSAENMRQIYVPKGLAHGFVVLSDEVEFLYKCDDFYAPGDEYGVAWDDPDLGIDWQLERVGTSSLVLSPKDLKLPRLAEIAPESLPLFPVG